LKAAEVAVNCVSWMQEEAREADARECAREFHANVPGLAHARDNDTGVCIQGEESFNRVRKTRIERLSDTGKCIDLLL
jgi:hypothetical protein